MTDTNPEVKTLKLSVTGMHCPNCEVLVERKFNAFDGVKRVRASHTRGVAQIDYTGTLDTGALNRAVEEDGYTVAPWSEHQNGRAKNTGRDYVEIGAVFLILAAVILILRQYELLPRGLSVSDNMSYGLVFVIGLVASVSSCIAVTGGLLVAVATKYNDATGFRPGLQRLKPLIFFNAGRILSYTLLGGVIGALGSALTLSAEANGILTLAASAVMIVLGLQMLKLLPSLGMFLPRMPKLLGHKVHDLATRDADGGAFILGAATFFLPCGFTQALQLYVLATGSFATGALTMLAFSLGTLPALLSLSAVSSLATGGVQRHFLKFAGAAVIVLGLMNIQYGLVLAGSGMQSAPEAAATSAAAPASPQFAAADEKQIVVMRIVDFDYQPNRFTVKQGVPVEWRIDSSEAAACGRFLLAPGLGIRQLLSSNSTTTISFTPTQTGQFAFNCGMGMMTPGSAITVVPNKNG
jgi:sulfite exporter TauE/SafE/copper chaperone CopZ